MAKVKHGKNYIKKEPIYSVDGDGRKVGVRLFYGDGKVVELLNQYGKTQKYYDELKDKRHFTNYGALKRDDNGEVKTLNTAARAYRSGYLDCIKENRRIYKSRRGSYKR